MEIFQCLTKLSPHKPNNPKIKSDVLIHVNRLGMNFFGERTNEKINIVTTGSNVKDATFSKGNEVPIISLGSRCALCFCCINIFTQKKSEKYKLIFFFGGGGGYMRDGVCCVNGYVRNRERD